MAQVLRHLPLTHDPRFLGQIGDDAVVYRVADDLAVVQSVDYITPVVDDPYTFGQIAAANALSDIYATGATPAFALNLAGYPVRSLPLAHLEQILSGGADKVAEAGAVIAGGHSIEDHAPKYGLAVTGFVHPDRVVTKGGGRPGDVLFLTKPLGSGIITTALDRREVLPEVEKRILPIMAALNRDAAAAMVRVGASACTDVTGFGLLGHLHSLAAASGLSAVVRAAAVPVLSEALELTESDVVSTGTRNNMRYLAEHVTWEASVTRQWRLLLCDAQTSGGLLIAVSAARQAAMERALAEAGCLCYAQIGELAPGKAGHLNVRR